ncbi:MAG: hypothetical protein WCV85_00965 [Patescibacteria group bacterium]|jgi:hypothetical protein
MPSHIPFDPDFDQPARTPFPGFLRGTSARVALILGMTIGMSALSFIGIVLFLLLKRNG